MNMLYEAFRAPYVGDAVSNFLDALSDVSRYGLYNAESPCGRTIAIVNSSGTGKSRFVDELGTQVLYSHFLGGPRVHHTLTGTLALHLFSQR